MPPLQKPSHYRNQCRQPEREKNHARKNTISADNGNHNNGSGQTNSNSNNKAPNNTNANNINSQKDDLDLSTHPVRHVVKLTEECYFGANAANTPPPRNRRPEGQNQVQQRNARSNSGGNVQAAAQTSN